MEPQCVSDLRVPMGELIPPELSARTGARRIEVREIEHAIVDATPYVRERLERVESQMFMLEQLVGYGDEPLYVRVGYLPIDVPRLSARVTEIDRGARIPTLPEVFESLYGVPFGGHETVVEAVPCEPHTARLLGVPEGDPILLREMLTRDANGTPWELSYTHYRGDIHTLVSEGTA
ncbi:UTRA domain-containing protein [Pseudonocardia sp. WMMC193]|uniref:UTRA domain-containing protein n=1 Tax=Pseudonocardia sp. WMMC193 TaxID=2911965 RepID=UPI001F221322|nr:UTRA domain-containing protein [Pseudonocardia sp. WMMC193]MCF7550453.1 UTRA domain-containing protein [Pseudonocardia sp. WMMC193]